MGKYRMEEPYGYMEQMSYTSSSFKEEIDGLFSDTTYDENQNFIYFYDKFGNKSGELDVSKFNVDKVIEEVTYDYSTQELIIKFTNGDVVKINVKDLIDESEFKDGLQVEDGVVSIKVDETGEGYEGNPYLSTSDGGLKLSGVDKHIEDAVAAEETRATSAETSLESKIDAEIENRTADIDAEETRATEAEEALDAKVDQEIADRIADVDAEEIRATEAEQELDSKIDEEIENRIADVNAEETRAKAEETALNSRINSLNDSLDAEKSIREAADVSLGLRIDKEIADRIEDVDTEEARAKAAEEALDAKVDQEIADRIADVDVEEVRAKAAEEALDAKVDEEIARAISAETDLNAAIAETFNNVEYVKNDKKIYFYNNDAVKGEIDATDFIKDGMVQDVKIENGNLVIDFNTESGIEDISIPLTEIFDPSNYYTKDDIDTKVSDLEAADTTLQNNIDAETARATSAETTLENAIEAEANARVTSDTTLQNNIDAETNNRAAADTILQSNIEAEAETRNNSDIALQENIEAETARATSAETDLQTAINLKADKETTYTKDEVDALLADKEAEITKANSEIYNLKKVVGDMGGNVTYDLPGEGKTFNTLMGNNGTVKLSEDVTTGRFGPGITAKNHVTLNLNNHDLTISGLTESSSQPAIMARGTQEITIGGKGTIDAGGGICVETTSTGNTVNLTGSTTVYQTDRSGGELIYCYSGTINITNGTFRNNGSDKTFMLNCYDANYRNGTAKIIVTGGKFYDFNPADNSAEGEHTNFLAEGYHVETSTVIEEGAEHTVYTVKKDA